TGPPSYEGTYIGASGGGRSGSVAPSRGHHPSTTTASEIRRTQANIHFLLACTSEKSIGSPASNSSAETTHLPRLRACYALSGLLAQQLDQVEHHLDVAFLPGQVPGRQPLLALALQPEIVPQALLEIRHVGRPVEDGDLLLAVG